MHTVISVRRRFQSMRVLQLSNLLCIALRFFPRGQDHKTAPLSILDLSANRELGESLEAERPRQTARTIFRWKYCSRQDVHLHIPHKRSRYEKPGARIREI